MDFHDDLWYGAVREASIHVSTQTCDELSPVSNRIGRFGGMEYYVWHVKAENSGLRMPGIAITRIIRNDELTNMPRRKIVSYFY